LPKIIINVPLELERQIRAKVQAGLYGSFDHFVEVALGNQILAEESDSPTWPSIVAETRSKGESLNSSTFPESSPSQGLAKQILLQQSKTQLELIALPTNVEPQLLTPPEDSMLMGTLIWGQFYRFLPIKPALRALAFQSQESLPNLASYRERACDVAQTIGTLLSNEDTKLGRKSGEKYSTSFPEPTAKSRRRYMDQYIVYVRTSDGKLDGMMARLKFINVTRDSGTYKIGLTQQGMEFAKLSNRLLDSEAKDNPLSIEEADFLIEHIIANLQSEARHMKAMLQLLHEGVSSRTKLNSKMGEFYSKYQEGNSKWTDAHINTMRAGLLSRMVELGLVHKTKLGLEVKYELTERGESVLRKNLARVN
jgi:hypothetical protein